MVGSSAAELESLNELIKFDHIYFKPSKAPSNEDIDSYLMKDTDIEPMFTLRDIENLEKLLDSHLVPKKDEQPEDLSFSHKDNVKEKMDLNGPDFSDSVFSDNYSNHSSPYSNSSSPSSSSSMLDDCVWEESFSELFPNLV